jgi:hypothetical protein
MKPLSPEFHKYAWDFKLLRRRDRIAMFIKTRGKSVSYEVVKVKDQKAHTWPAGNTTEACENLPGSNEWGVKGWTYQTEEDALHKFNALAASQQSQGEPASSPTPSTRPRSVSSMACDSHIPDGFLPRAGIDVGDGCRAYSRDTSPDAPGYSRATSSSRTEPASVQSSTNGAESDALCAQLAATRSLASLRTTKIKGSSILDLPVDG